MYKMLIPLILIGRKYTLDKINKRSANTGKWIIELGGK